MSLIDAIIWIWTLSSMIGLPICARSLHDAWLDWSLQHDSAKSGGVPTRNTADRLSVAWQSVLSNLLGVGTQLSHLLLGLVVLLVDGPARYVLPLLLLAPQLGAVAFAVMDRRIRNSLLRDYANRQERGAVSDRQPPYHARERQE